MPDLEEGIAAFRRIGFTVTPGGVHPGKGTHNAIAFHQDDYLELLSLRDRDAPAAPGSSEARLAEFLARGGGFRYVAVQSDDLAADVAAMRARGVDVSDVSGGARRTPEGRELSWKAASLGPRNPLPIFFVQHLTPLAERRLQVAGAGDHPNGVLRLDRVYIAVSDLGAVAESYARVLGMPVPKIQRGAVIKADMAVFDLGPGAHSITIKALASPYQSGAAYFRVDLKRSHMMCYRIKEQGKFKQRTVRTEDQFGRAQMRVVDPLMLCVPASKTELLIK